MALIDIFSAIKWWAILLIMGVLAFPITFRLFNRLPDRGYAFAKMVGLLLISYLFWLLGTLGFLRNSNGAILFSVLLLALLAVWSVRGHWKKSSVGARNDTPGGILVWIRANWRYIASVELLFTIAFAIWVWVRAQNPAISGTEKPMEFAFLNSIARSPDFPPLDPWLSGYGISYYYFGYIMTSVVTRLAAVPEQVGFNLANAWLFAATALGSFGVVYNLIKARQVNAQLKATLFGVIAAVSITAAGNSEMLFELLHANNFGSNEFWTWLDIRELNNPPNSDGIPRYETSQWWWWRSSRVIHEYHLSGIAEEGLEPIAEFPAFSFILADLHAHVLALPFSIFSIAVAFTWYAQGSSGRFGHRSWSKSLRFQSIFASLRTRRGTLFLFTALLLGGLSFLNTWDVAIHLILIASAYTIGRWRDLREWRSAFLIEGSTLAVLLSIVAIVIYIPFYLGFRSQAGAPFLLPMAMQPTRLIHMLAIFGLPLLGIVSLIGTVLVNASRRPVAMSPRRPWLRSLSLTMAILVVLFLMMLVLGWVIALSPEGEGRIIGLARELELNLTEPPEGGDIGARIIWATQAVAALGPFFLLARVQQPWMILFLSALFTAVIYIFLRLLNKPKSASTELIDRDINPLLPFILLLIGLGTLLVLVPEFVYLRDNFGQRLNTIFKFYYQAWVFWGIAAVYGIYFLWEETRVIGAVAAMLYGLLLIVALLFPYYAVQSRADEYRGSPAQDNRLPATLDGLAYLKVRDPAEYDAIMWLRNNIDGAPVILEATGGQYSAYGRVSTSTGLPTVLGWAGHEFQWRGYTAEPGDRAPAIDTIYGPGNWIETASLLDKYNVSLVYYGTLERLDYGTEGREKFDDNLDLAYRNSGVSIYRWHPE